jgi:hypothetical protein
MKRTEAIAAGLDRYNSGKPCKWGHDTGRYTSTGQCVECARQASRGQSLAVRHGMLAARHGLESVTVRVIPAHADALRKVADDWNASAGIPTFNGGMGIGAAPGAVATDPAALIPPAARMGAPGGAA